MKCTLADLSHHLTKGFKPIYLLSGDETLLVEEARELLRNAAKNQGYEITRLTPDPTTAWGSLVHETTQSISLFSQQKCIELDLRQTKLLQANTGFLKTYAENPAPNTLLIICFTKLDKRTEQSAWFQALEKNGVHIPIWPIPLAALPQWILTRAKQKNLVLTKNMADWIAAQVEGNLFAAAQEIEKLSLLNTSLDQSALQEAISDSAYFNVFDLSDSLLSGTKERALRILNQLALEDTELPLVLWAITRELRTMADILTQQKEGKPLSLLFKQHRIFEKREPLVRAFLKRHTENTCWHFLKEAAEIDTMIKGADIGNPWDALQKLALKICYA